MSTSTVSETTTDDTDFSIASTDSSVEQVVDAKDVKAYRRIFKEADFDGTGGLNSQQLQRAMRHLGTESSDDELEMVFRKKGETISFNDFCAIVQELKSLNTDTVRVAFDILKEAGKKHITESSLARELRRLNAPFSKAQLSAMMPSEKITLTVFDGLVGDGVIRENSNPGSSSDQSEGAESSWSYSSDTFSSAASDNLVVTAQAFYTGETFYVTCNVDQTLAKFANLVSRQAQHPAHRYRMYFRGLPLRDYSKTLGQIGLTQHCTVVFIYLSPDDPLPKYECFAPDGKPWLENIRRCFLREGVLSRDDAYYIIIKAEAILKKEPVLLHLEEPVSVISDLHGQFFDLGTIFNAAGTLGEDTFLFLGDYGDRGYFSYEVILYLLAAKIRHPSKVWLLRGNHENKRIMVNYGSHWEGALKYDKKLHKTLVRCFDSLPTAAIIRTGGNHRVLCMHGGLTTHLSPVSALMHEDKKANESKGQVLYDAVWTDPDDDCQRKTDKGRIQHTVPDKLLRWDLDNLTKRGIEEDVDREEAELAFGKLDIPRYTYKQKALLYYLKANDLLCILRGHQTSKDGVYLYRDGPIYKFPACISIFSAPNYVDSTLQMGTVARFESNGTLNLVRYPWVLHPIYEFRHPGECDHRRESAIYIKDIFAEDVIVYTAFTSPELLKTMKLQNLLHACRAQYGSGVYSSDYDNFESMALREVRAQTRKLKTAKEGRVAPVNPSWLRRVPVSEYGGGYGGTAEGDHPRDAQRGYYGLSFLYEDNASGLSSDSFTSDPSDDKSSVAAGWRYIRLNLINILRSSDSTEASDLVERHTDALLSWQAALGDGDAFEDTQDVSEVEEEEHEDNDDGFADTDSASTTSTPGDSATTSYTSFSMSSSDHHRRHGKHKKFHVSSNGAMSDSGMPGMHTRQNNRQRARQTPSKPQQRIGRSASISYIPDHSGEQHSSTLAPPPPSRQQAGTRTQRARAARLARARRGRGIRQRRLSGSYG